MIMKIFLVAGLTALLGLATVAQAHITLETPQAAAGWAWRSWWTISIK